MSIVVATILAGCGLFGLFNSAPPPSQANSQSPSLNKAYNIIPEKTPYETIHNLEFSLQFNNTGGIQNKLNATGEVVNNNYIDKEKAQPYSVFGTGWLFDWKLNTEKPDNAGNVDWTGYFATNLHVADGLLNPEDNKSYKPSWLSSSIQTRIYDQTFEFNLGKYDNSDGPLSSVNNSTNLTYVRIGMNNSVINTLPTTQFAAINFVNPGFRQLGIVGNNIQTKEPTGKYQPYIDFAVLAVNIKYINRNQIFLSKDEIAENNVWTQWIQPAIQTLQTLYLPNPTNPNLTYQEMFNSTPYLSQTNPNPGNIYIGGYPFSKTSQPPYYASKTNQKNLGSPIWTINADKNTTTYSGQPLDFTSNSSGPLTPKGLYNANANLNFMLNYHGQDYKQYGFGYIVANSNLASGSSGSMALDNNNQLLGIYYGTLENPSTKQESPIGLVQSLIALQVPTILSSNQYYKIYPYDLIGWSSNSKITTQSISYFSSLDDPTYLFSQPNTTNI